MEASWLTVHFYQQILYFLQMKTKQSPQARAPLVRQPQNNPKPHPTKPKRQFYVQQHRKEIDDYMMGQIKKNKKSIKHIKQEIDLLRNQMNELKEQNKKQRVDCEVASQRGKIVRGEKCVHRLDVTAKKLLSKERKGEETSYKTRRQFVVSKDSSETSRRSSRVTETLKNKSQSTAKIIHNTLRKNSPCGKQESNSRILLKQKIEDLKEKAYAIKQSAEEIQTEIHKKIEKKIELASQQHIGSISNIKGQGNDGYEELMELLKTNKHIQDTLKEAIPSNKKVETPPKVEVHHQLSLSMNERHNDSPHCEEKSMVSTNRDPNYLKNSAAVSYYTMEHKDHNQRPSSSSQLPSQTNLLDSDKNIGIKNKLKLSHCLNLQIVSDDRHDEFDELLQRSVSKPLGADLSFENESNHERQLKELQFQFDQLVRQQLLSNDPTQKEILGNNIRSLLSRISSLKEEMQQSR